MNACCKSNLLDCPLPLTSELMHHMSPAPPSDKVTVTSLRHSLASPLHCCVLPGQHSTSSCYVKGSLSQKCGAFIRGLAPGWTMKSIITPPEIVCTESMCRVLRNLLESCDLIVNLLYCSECPPGLIISNSSPQPGH